MDIKFAFFGTPDFSTHVLDALKVYGFLPALVITAPDKPRGRGLKLSPSAVKKWALERNIDVLQPHTLKDESIVGELQNTNWDVFVVAAYAKLLPEAVLNIPRKGCLNVHPSLLPRFRGPSPVASAILADERETGVTIMQMAVGMDAGPVVAQAKIEIEPDDWPPPATTLTNLFFAEGGSLLAETLPLWISSKIDPVPQDDSHATLTRKFADEDALIDLSFAADQREQFLKIRAFDRNPRAHFYAERNGKKIRVIVSEAYWQNGQLVIEKVIPEGKKCLLYKDFLESSTSY